MVNSEPNLGTDPNLLNVLRELMRHESSLHQPAPEMTRDDIEQMMDADFWEVGASGRRYGRELVLSVLEQRAAQPAEEPWPTWDAHCCEIAADNYLLTYSVAQGKRITRRASIWRRTQGRWEIVYHQGTVVEPVS
jgi:hypothetical protein